MASCAGQQRGSQVAIVIDYETTFGSDPGAPAGIQVPFLSESLTATRAQNTSEVINGTRNPSRPFQGNTDISGDITVPVDKRYFGYWLKALFGAPTTTGAGPYTHVYKVDDTACQPSLVLQKDFSDLPQFFKYNGVKVGSMALTVGGDGEVTATLSLLGASLTESGTDYDATPTTHVYEQFRSLDAALNEGGSASAEFTELSIDINANLDGDVYAIGDGGNRSAIPEGKYSMEGSGTILFDNMTLYNKALNQTESSIEVIYTRDSHSLTIDFNEVEYGLNSPQVSGNEGVNLNLDFQAYDDDDAANSAVEITLINDVASY
jgi:hypothetical protein